MANIARRGGKKRLFSKTVIAKIENNLITDIIWDPDKRIKSWSTLRFMEGLSYDASHIIMNIFEWAAEGRLRV